jgi:hypothetical protein
LEDLTDHGPCVHISPAQSDLELVPGEEGAYGVMSPAHADDDGGQGARTATRDATDADSGTESSSVTAGQSGISSHVAIAACKETQHLLLFLTP